MEDKDQYYSLTQTEKLCETTRSLIMKFRHTEEYEGDLEKWTQKQRCSASWKLSMVLN